MNLAKEQLFRHILIIDDSEDSLSLLKLLLESNGYTTECTSNGAEALKLLYSSEKLPQTILLDLNMPVMCGRAFQRIQRIDPLLKKIRVVLMTGEYDIEELSNETGTEVLHKPFGLSTLLEKVACTT